MYRYVEIFEVLFVVFISDNNGINNDGIMAFSFFIQNVITWICVSSIDESKKGTVCALYQYKYILIISISIILLAIIIIIIIHFN